MRHKSRVQYDYTGYVYCGDPDCEAEMEATYYPGSPGSWEAPPCGPEVDGPDECPECGRETTKQDRQAWAEKLGDEVDDGE